MRLFESWHSGPKIWLIGGTSESIVLAEQIQNSRIPLVITVTTEAACQNYRQAPETWVQQVRFETDETLRYWLRQGNITGILDASHPFAVEISKRAIRVAQRQETPYLRYERASVTAVSSAHVSVLKPDLSEVSRETLLGHRILLTVGSHSLVNFASWHAFADLFARILPSETALKLAFQAGFHRDRLIALQPPVSFELEQALWRHWQISLVITKASGPAGGEETKRRVAQSLQVPLWVIQRPPIDYPWQTQSIKTVMHFARRVTA
ncbi:MAG: cobalt-precorrin-6A reductase [Cyanobacteria bacterium P01_F01_bin.42]